MKKLLITGENSYIGNSIKKWLQRFPDEYIINSISLRDERWKEADFTYYDAIIHVAGLAHIKETKKNADLYYKVNRDLAVEVANKAKSEGVHQFILFSTMNVYGLNTGIIHRETIPYPKMNYGISKLQADRIIAELEDESFRLAILRPPMVYGSGCKGNYQTLAKLAVKLQIFPDIKNERSMIYIDNLAEFVKQCLDQEKRGLFFPQNKEYACTSQMVKLIAEAHGKSIRFTKLFNPLIHALKLNITNKVFGNLIYEKDDDFDYEVCGFKESIIKSELLIKD